MRPGDVFRITDAINGLDPHIYVVISDPSQNADQIVAVNFTKVAPHKEQVCVVLRRDYTKLGYDSCINYGQFDPPAVFSLGQYNDWLGEGKLTEWRPGVSRQVLERILAGAGRSGHIPLEVFELLDLQGLIPPEE